MEPKRQKQVKLSVAVTYNNRVREPHGMAWEHKVVKYLVKILTQYDVEEMSVLASMCSKYEDQIKLAYGKFKHFITAYHRYFILNDDKTICLREGVSVVKPPVFHAHHTANTNAIPAPKKPTTTSYIPTRLSVSPQKSPPDEMSPLISPRNNKKLPIPNERRSSYVGPIEDWEIELVKQISNYLWENAGVASITDITKLFASKYRQQIIEKYKTLKLFFIAYATDFTISEASVYLNAMLVVKNKKAKPPPSINGNPPNPPPLPSIGFANKKSQDQGTPLKTSWEAKLIFSIVQYLLEHGNSANYGYISSLFPKYRYFIKNTYGSFKLFLQNHPHDVRVIDDTVYLANANPTAPLDFAKENDTKSFATKLRPPVSFSSIPQYNPGVGTKSTMPISIKSDTGMSNPTLLRAHTQTKSIEDDSKMRKHMRRASNPDDSALRNAISMSKVHEALSEQLGPLQKTSHSLEYKGVVFIPNRYHTRFLDRAVAVQLVDCITDFVQPLIRELATNSMLAVAYHGQQQNEAYRLFTVTVFPFHGDQCYCFDLFKCPELIAALAPIFANPKCVKIMFQSPTCSESLYNAHNIHVHYITDLVVLHTMILQYKRTVTKIDIPLPSTPPTLYELCRMYIPKSDKEADELVEQLDLSQWDDAFVEKENYVTDMGKSVAGIRQIYKAMQTELTRYISLSLLQSSQIYSHSQSPSLATNELPLLAARPTQPPAENEMPPDPFLANSPSAFPLSFTHAKFVTDLYDNKPTVNSL